jgi:ferredoxin
MAKYKIIFDREACIGALACNAVAPKFYLLADDGKVDLSKAVLNPQTKKFELVIETDALEINKEAADACPVHAIVIQEIK